MQYCNRGKTKILVYNDLLRLIRIRVKKTSQDFLARKVSPRVAARVSDRIICILPARLSLRFVFFLRGNSKLFYASIVVFNKYIDFSWRSRQILSMVISINIWHSKIRDAI